MRAPIVVPALFGILTTAGCLQSSFPTACEQNEAQCEDSAVDSSSGETSTVDSAVDETVIDDTSSADTNDTSIVDSAADGEVATAIDADADADDGVPADADALGDGTADGDATLDANAVVDGNPDVSSDSAADIAMESNANPCAAVVCNAPPSAVCLDHATRRTFATAGTCSGGACTYATIDTACPTGEFCSGGVCAAPPSCTGGLTCGADSCCTSPFVPGGTFKRGYDGVTAGHTDPQYVATISDFRLDKYEITVGRFRKFVDAVAGGWRPAAGSGKHSHLNGGGGLNAGTEPGWEPTWNSGLPTTKATWDQQLAGCGNYSSWTPSPGSNETRPIHCLGGFQASAFCIWDGGFLPTDAELNYAAAGGSEQRKYPWGATDPGANAEFAVYGCYFGGTGTCTGLVNLPPVGSVPAGNGRWGHSDLAGGVWEFASDMTDSDGSGGYLITVCNDCADFSTRDRWVMRGGGYESASATLLTASWTTTGGEGPGARCARPR